MSKDCYRDQRLIEYLAYRIKEMSVDKKLQPVLIDILLRRIFEYDLSPTDIEQDVDSLVNNLKSIEVKKMPKKYSKVGGYYDSIFKKIVLNERYVDEAVKNPDNPKLYEILTHEVYHALSRDENGHDRLVSKNQITGKNNFSLLEAIIEKAADRCVYPRDTGVAPYYKQNVFGYSNITFITDAIAATYGVTEKEFLKNAIMGRKRLISFLATQGAEKKSDTARFLDRIEVNFSRLHNTLYPEKNQPKDQEKMKIDAIKDSMTGIYSLCERKFAERLERTRVSGIRQASGFLNEAKFNHNRLTCVMENALYHFSNIFNRNDILSDVIDRVEDSKLRTSYRINDLDEIMLNHTRIPHNQILPLINESKSGRLPELDKSILTYYGLTLRGRTTFNETARVKDKYYYCDFSQDSWENYDITRYVAKICARKARQEAVNPVKLAIGRFLKSKLLLDEPSEEYEFMHNLNIAKEKRDPFYKIPSEQTPRVSARSNFQNNNQVKEEETR